MPEMPCETRDAGAAKFDAIIDKFNAIIARLDEINSHLDANARASRDPPGRASQDDK